jgi:hypothetical protein
MQKGDKMVNNFLSMLNPQMQNSFQSLQMQAMQSGNPQQFLMQRFGNNPNFSEGLKIFNEKGIQGLNEFIASKIK